MLVLFFSVLFRRSVSDADTLPLWSDTDALPPFYSGAPSPMLMFFLFSTDTISLNCSSALPPTAAALLICSQNYKKRPLFLLSNKSDNKPKKVQKTTKKGKKTTKNGYFFTFLDMFWKVGYYTPLTKTESVILMAAQRSPVHLQKSVNRGEYWRAPIFSPLPPLPLFSPFSLLIWCRCSSSVLSSLPLWSAAGIPSVLSSLPSDLLPILFLKYFAPDAGALLLRSVPAFPLRCWCSSSLFCCRCSSSPPPILFPSNLLPAFFLYRSSDASSPLP